MRLAKAVTINWNCASRSLLKATESNIAILHLAFVYFCQTILKLKDIPPRQEKDTIMCFFQELAREKERLHQFTPIDDSLCPITDTEVKHLTSEDHAHAQFDFTPLYLI